MVCISCRKRQLDEEQKQIDAIKKEKEWKQEWDVSVIVYIYLALTKFSMRKMFALQKYFAVKLKKF